MLAAQLNRISIRETGYMRDDISSEGIEWQPTTAGYKQEGNDAITELCMHISFSFGISLH